MGCKAGGMFYIFSSLQISEESPYERLLLVSEPDLRFSEGLVPRLGYYLIQSTFTEVSLKWQLILLTPISCQNQIPAKVIWQFVQTK